MTEIYLIRHAEAEGNVYRRIHGQYDSLITPNGYRQIDALRARFAPVRIDACYASDLTRTCITAGALCLPKQLPLHCDARFREVALGCWEDRSFGYLDVFEQESMQQFNGDPLHWHMEGAERFGEYTGRFLAGLEEAARANDGKTIAVVTHGCVLRGVQLRLFFDPSRPGVQHCDNTAVSHLYFDDGSYRCDYLNDNSHLAPEISTLGRQSWWRSNPEKADFNLWYRPLTDGTQFLEACRRTETAGGDAPVEEERILADFQKLSGADAGAIMTAMLADKPVGTVAMQESGRFADAAIVYLFELAAPYRGKGYGTQLLGAAVSWGRKKGKKRLLLQVCEKNLHALGFYLHCGFQTDQTIPIRPGKRYLTMEIDTEAVRARVLCSYAAQ